VAIVFIVLGVVGVVLLGLRFGLSRMGETTIDEDEWLRNARVEAEQSQWERAEKKLALIDYDNLDSEQRAEYDAIKVLIEQKEEVSDEYIVDEVGQRWFNTYLGNYEKNYLQGDPEPERVRLFLERCNEFRERWPGHPQLEWIKRQETRFAGMVRLSDPPTFAYVKLKVKVLTDTSPRHYDEAFAQLEGYEPLASEEERVEIAALRAQMISERKTYAVDRLHQAKYELERKESPSKAVWWLVNSVLYLGDQALEDEAAGYLIKMPHLDEHLLGYKSKYPDMFEGLMETDIVRRKARELGVE
jgi:hypothetical protein